MGYRPQAYADADVPAVMLRDAQRAALVVPLLAVVPGRPSHTDKVKQEISIDEAVHRLAAAITE